MKVSASALPFLILAATLGPLALGLPTHGDQGSGSLSLNHELSLVLDHGFMEEGGKCFIVACVHHPPDCCFSYTTRNIRCQFMESYYRTSSGCSLPAVVFMTKRGQEVCADPRSRRVQHCIDQLDSAHTEKELR